MQKAYGELFKSSDLNFEPVNDSLFTDVCSTGGFSKMELADHLNTTPSWQVKHLETLFNHMKNGGTFSRTPQHTTDNGQDVTWLVLTIGKVAQKVKIIHFANIKQLIDDYASGHLKINHSLEELYNEALS